MATFAPAPSLLTLPAELRNTIYELVLCESDDIVIDSNFTLPPLLRVNQQIRKESSDIYYNTNSFEVLVDHCDSQPMFKWTRHLHAIGQDNVDFILDLKETPDWHNLRKWAKVIWRNQEPGMTPLERGRVTDNHTEDTVYSAHAIAAEHRGQPWRVCKAELEELHHEVAWQVDERWWDSESGGQSCDEGDLGEDDGDGEFQPPAKRRKVSGRKR